MLLPIPGHQDIATLDSTWSTQCPGLWSHSDVILVNVGFDKTPIKGREIKRSERHEAYVKDRMEVSVRRASR